MNKFKKISALLPALILALVLCACGEVPPEAGKYTGAGFEHSGVSYADMSLRDAYVELGTGGKGILSLDDKSGEISWSAEGEKLSFNIAGSSYSATLSDGVLKLQISEDVNVIFLKGGAEMPKDSALSLPLDYYGWWRIVSSEGEMPETWIDCCARLSLEDGVLYFTIWDEDGSMDKPMGRAAMGIADGVPVSQWGDFWYSELSEGQWQLKSETNEEIGTEVIKLSGEALDRSGGKFTYEIFLRPWGENWENANKDAVPYYYNTWYLPLIEEGAEMPESFEGAESPLNVEKPNREENPENAENNEPAEPAEAPQIHETPQPTPPAESGESSQGSVDFNDDELSGFTDDFEG